MTDFTTRSLFHQSTPLSPAELLRIRGAWADCLELAWQNPNPARIAPLFFGAASLPSGELTRLFEQSAVLKCDAPVTLIDSCGAALHHFALFEHGELAREFAKLSEVVTAQPTAVPRVRCDAHVAYLYKICECCTAYFLRRIGGDPRLCLICREQKPLRVPGCFRLFADCLPRLRRSW